MAMSVFATRCDTAAVWLLATLSNGRISVAGADAAPVLVSGSAAGWLSRVVSRWHAEMRVTRATRAAIRIIQETICGVRLPVADSASADAAAVVGRARRERRPFDAIRHQG